MVKSILLDNVRFWGLILKRKNQRILLIHVISHEAIVSKAWHASYVIITSSILLYLPQEQFSHGGEAGYSQEYAFSLKKTKNFLIPWDAVGNINNLSSLLHSQSLSIGHYSLTLIYNSGIWRWTLISKAWCLVFLCVLCMYRLHWGIRQTYVTPP